MDYIKIRFGQNLDQLHNQLGRTIEQMFRSVNPMFDVSVSRFKPQMDIYETPEEIVVVGEIAGVLKEDLEVELDSRALRISGRRQEPAREPDMRFHLVEIPYGAFERIIYLPAPVDPEQVTASYTNGMLQIRMKKRQADGPMRVNVQETP